MVLMVARPLLLACAHAAIASSGDGATGGVGAAACDFPFNTSAVRYAGLGAGPTSAKTEADCAAACCRMQASQCALYQWTAATTDESEPRCRVGPFPKKVAPGAPPAGFSSRARLNPAPTPDPPNPAPTPAAGPCPCGDPKWCRPLNAPPVSESEIFPFVIGNAEAFSPNGSVVPKGKGNVTADWYHFRWDL